MELVVLVFALVSGLSMLGVITYLERPRGPLQTVELRFGTDLTPEKTEAMLSSIAGLRSNAVVLLDAVADECGIRHFLHAPQPTLDTLRSQWRGVLPSLVMDQPDNPPPGQWRVGALLRLTGVRPVLRSDASVESSAALLGSMMPLARGERLLLRWYLGAQAHPSLPQSLSRRDAHKAGTGLAHLLLQESTPQAAHVRALRTKHAGPVLGGLAIVAVNAAHPKRRAHLLSRVISTMRSRGGAYGHFTIRRRGRRWLSWLLNRPAVHRPDLYAPNELAGLLPIPIGAPQVPGLSLGTAPVLMPSPRIPSTGRVLAVSTWPGSDRTLAQPIIGGLPFRTTMISSPTGTWESPEFVGALGVQGCSSWAGFVSARREGRHRRERARAYPRGSAL